MSYGEIIKQIRGQMTLREFSKQVGISHSHLSRIENEKTSRNNKKLKVSIDVLKQICDRAEYPFKDFLIEAGYLNPNE